MTAYAIPRESNSRAAGLLLLLAVALVLMAIVFTSHARRSHAEHVPEINRCFNGNGTISGWFQGPDGRYSRHCNAPGKHSYWRIYECVKGDLLVITQFKQATRRLAKYIVNKRFVQAGEPPCLRGG